MNFYSMFVVNKVDKSLAVHLHAVYVHSVHISFDPSSLSTSSQKIHISQIGCKQKRICEHHPCNLV